MAVERAIVDPAAPKWGQDLARRILVPKAPTPIPNFATSAAFPPAADYPNCYAAADGVPYYSDGTSWNPVGSVVLDELGNAYRLAVTSLGPALTIDPIP